MRKPTRHCAITLQKSRNNSPTTPKQLGNNFFCTNVLRGNFASRSNVAPQCKTNLNMGENKTSIFTFPDAGAAATNNSLAAMLPALLQNRGIDSAALMGMMANGNNGFFGNNGGVQDIIALIVIAAIFGNGNFGFGGNGNGRGDTERQMLMDAIQRNGIDISQLASAVGCSKDQILAGINGVSSAICGLGNQMGQNTNQIITTLMQGNNALASQLAQCCCENRLAMCQQTNTIQSGFNGVNIGVERGFSSLGYAMAEQACQSRQNADANTRAVLAKLDAIEDSRKDRELAEKDRIIATLTARSERQAELAPIYKQLSDIACKTPETVTIPYSPVVGVPSCVAAQYGLGFGLNGFPGSTGFWG